MITLKSRAWAPPLLLAALLALPALLVRPAMAAPADPAEQTVEALDNGLLAILHAGAAAGQAGRARAIGPVVDRAFDLPLMTRLAVGPQWLGISAYDQAGLIAAFRAVTIAQYAHNFDGFSGQRFAVTGPVETRGLDRLVRTVLSSPGDGPEQLGYRLRENGGQWRIIDVYFRNGISQLSTRRSDFAEVLAKGGAPALIAHLGQLAANPK